MRQKMRTGFRFAVVGCGEAGSRRAAAISNVDGAQIAVCVDSIRDRADELAATYGTDSSTDWRASIIRSDVDAVVIAVSNNLHAPIATAAAESGKHILCERPIARNPSEGEQIVRAAREYDVRLKVGSSLRYHPVVAKAYELIKEGRIGKITFLRGRTGRGSYAAAPASWAVNGELSGGGTLLDNGTDLLDLCRYFMGDFRKVIGQASTLLWPIEPCEDNAFAILSTTDNRTAIIHASWTDWEGYLYLEISGADGYIKLDYDNSTLAIGSRPGIEGAGLEDVIDLSTQPGRSLETEVEELINAVNEHREPSGSGLDGLEALILAHAVYRSSEDGKAVRV